MWGIINFDPMITQIFRLEFTNHLKKPYLWWGGLLYLVGVIFISYLNFSLTVINLPTWIALFWIIHLFLALQLGNKGNESFARGHFYTYYQLASPETIILGRMLYGFIELLVFTLIGFALFMFYFPTPAGNIFVLAITLVLSCMALSVVIYFTNALSRNSQQTGLLSSILSFPVVLPVLLIESKLTKNALDDLDFGSSTDELLILASIFALSVGMSVILYPIAWKT